MQALRSSMRCCRLGEALDARRPENLGLLQRTLSIASLSKRGSTLLARADWQRVGDVAVLGSGIMGLTTALQIKQRWGDVSVDVIFESTLVESTSHGAGGLWEPYQIEGSADEDINRWGGATYSHFQELLLSPDCNKSGVQFLACHQIFTQAFLDAHGGAVAAPSWAPIVHNYVVHAPGDALQLYGSHGEIAQMHEFGTYVVDQPRYLHFLKARLEEDHEGVTLKHARAQSFEEVAELGYQCVFNCTGWGAHEIAADADMIPVRGQVRRMYAPWQKHAVMLDKEFYILPNVDSVVVGGTQQRGLERTKPVAADAKKIWAAAVRMWPGIAGADPIDEWAGVRPVRTSGVRIERELIEAPAGGSVPLVHNYGHGGSGITLHWGCVQQALELADADLQRVVASGGSGVTRAATADKT
eukprot:jgi/Ulvmu1/6897/UM031_0103.1